MRTVCLITPNHIATNPRLVKEAQALQAAGYRVHLLFTQESTYSSRLDQQLLNANPEWAYTRLDWTGRDKRSKLNRAVYGLAQKVARKIFFRWRLPRIAYAAINRNFFWQLAQAKKIDAALYIAHNLGALPVAVLAAENRKAIAGFDAEDFHRHEASDDVGHPEVQLKATVENHCIPSVRHFTAASPMIGDAYRQLFPTATPVVVLNVFSPPAPVRQQPDASAPLKLFWFSQTVGANRGLQDVFRAMRHLHSKAIVLDIYGVVPESVRMEFAALLAGLSFPTPPAIAFKGTIPPDDLMDAAAGYDIGLAIEPGFSVNNRIALSNKIFTYLCGGTAILFSDTPAQQAFYAQHPNVGFLYHAGDDQGLANQISRYWADRQLLQEHQQNSARLFASRLNWHKEQEIFLGCVAAAMGINRKYNAAGVAV